MPTINLKRSRYQPPGWRGWHPRRAWPAVDLTDNMAGYSVQRNYNAPPPPPKLDIILIHGNYNATIPLARQLAQDLGQHFIHIHINHSLYQVNALPSGKQKTCALGVLHPLALQRFLQRETRSLSPKLIIEQVLLRHINNLVASGKTHFIITGFADFESLWHFKRSIAKPDAVIWLEEPDTRDVKGWMRREFGERACVFLEGWGQGYAGLLAEMGMRAMLRPKDLVRDERKARNEMVLIITQGAMRSKRDTAATVKVEMEIDDMMLDDVADGVDVKMDVKREDTPVAQQDSFDEAMDLVQGLEEDANADVQDV